LFACEKKMHRNDKNFEGVENAAHKSKAILSLELFRIRLFITAIHRFLVAAFFIAGRNMHWKMRGWEKTIFVLKCWKLCVYERLFLIRFSIDS